MQSKLAIIILAAGTSSRMQTPKQLLIIDDKTLLEKSIDTAISIENASVFCVLGAYFNEIAPKIKHYKIQLIKNDEYEKGLSTSIVASIKTIKSNFNTCLLMLADQPEVNPTFLQNMIHLYHKNQHKIIATAYNNSVGVPALFNSVYFEELLQLKGDVGAKKIIQKHLQNTHLIQLQKPLLDLDTPLDFQTFKNLKNF